MRLRIVAPLTRLALAAAWLAAASLAAGAPVAAAEITALVGGALIDGFSPRPIADSVVLIEGERIAAVGTVDTLPIPEGAEVISTEGMSVLPGLWDMHVHLMIAGHADYAHWDATYPDRFRDVIMPASAKQLLLAGVTSARDLGAPLEDSIAVRDAIERGEIPGPTMYMSGPFIQKEPYPGTELFRWGVDGADDARAKVRRLAEAGVDVVKLIDQDQMTMAEVEAVVDEAHRHDLPVVAHGHRPKEILRGLAAGVDCFEHTGLSTAPEYPADVMAALEERTAQMNRGPLFWTPTISVLYNYPYITRWSELLDDPSWKVGLPEEIVDDIAASISHPERLPYFQLTPSRHPTLKRKFAQLRQAGVTLLVGTDSGVPLTFHSQSTWNELDIWVRVLGVEPMEAIRAATYWPAVAMGVADDVGTIVPGKYADIVAVRGDVLRYVNLLADVDLVIKRGRRYK
ncbi:MAG: amidohydrolase family protein [Thermoanaerobaculia bacterium]|nr:amidohydrolase family protein [Thermoanaerobaculia bacterium]